MEIIALIVTILALLVTVVFGFLQVVVPFIKGEVRFSTRFPFVESTDKPSPRRKRKKARRKHRVTIPIIAVAVVIIIIVLIRILVIQTIPERPLPIAVISFENLTGDETLDYLCKAIPNLLITNLEQSAYLSVMTWERMHDLLDIVEKDDTERIDKEIGFELCRIDSIEAIVVGSFTKAGEVFTTELKVLDVDTKQLLKTSSASGEGIASILKFQIDELSRNISRIVGLSEKIIEIKQKPIAEVTTNSMDAYNYFIRGRAEFDRLYWKEANRFLSKAVELDSNFATAHLYLAMSYFGLGALNASQAAHEKAKIHSAQATEKERLYIEAHYAWRVERDYPRAAGIYRQIARMFPKEKRAHYGLGEYYRRVGEYEQAIVAFEKTLQLDPNFGPGLNYAAYTYVKIGDLEKALEYAKRYAQVNPADANPFDTMGDIYVEMGKYDNALAKYKEALNVKPDFGTDFKVGYLYALREDYTQARRWAEQGVMNAPTPEMRIIASLWVCFYQYWLGSMEECLQGLKAIETSDLTSDAIRATAYWLEAWVHFEAGNPAACKQAFRNSSSFIYFTIPSLIGMGRVELKQGNIAGARSRYLEVETLSTAVPASLGDWTRFCIDVLRAELMLAHDSVDSAIEACRKMPVVELFPQYYASSLYQNTPRDRDLLARSYYAKGDIDKAIAEYEKLTAFYSERDDRYLIHPTWHYELALLYEKAGMNEKASAEYTKFLDLYKNADKNLPAIQEAQERFPALKKR